MTVALILADKGRDVFTVDPQTAVSDVVDTLASKKIGAIVVTDASGVVCGIVSERDIVREISLRGAGMLDQPVSHCMTRKVVSCSEEDTIDAVMGIMTRNRFRHLPVTASGKLTGIVSIGDVVKRKIEQAVRDAEELRNYIAG
ncbi:MAG: CBS domain-containing protein [Nitratireductor sp.]|nr:CBS domain-containing protein [Nitratireductor sp.]MCB1459493.1 CBS domain-containing protein [Nitratireductor sp.]